MMLGTTNIKNISYLFATKKNWQSVAEIKLESEFLMTEPQYDNTKIKIPVTTVQDTDSKFTVDFKRAQR
jgi:hypothetical protein